MGNDITKNLLKKIKDFTEGKLKSLDLYGNNLTPAIIEDVVALIE